MRNLKKLIVLKGKQDVGKSHTILLASRLPDKSPPQNWKETFVVKERTFVCPVSQSAFTAVVAYASIGDDKLDINNQIRDLEDFETQNDREIDIVVFACRPNLRNLLNPLKGQNTEYIEINKTDFDHLYNPNSDSYLTSPSNIATADAIEYEIEKTVKFMFCNLTKSDNNPILLEK